MNDLGPNELTIADDVDLRWIWKINGLPQWYIEIDYEQLGENIISDYEDDALDVNRYRYDVATFREYADLPKGHLMCCYGEFDYNLGELDEDDEYDEDLHVFIGFECEEDMNEALEILANKQT